MKLVKMGFINFIRTKSNRVSIIMLSICFALIEITISYRQIVQKNVDNNMDSFSYIIFNIFNKMTLIIILIIIVVLPLIAILKLNDNTKYIALLKCMGYTNRQTTILQSAEYGFLFFTSFMFSIAFSLFLNNIVVKRLLRSYMENKSLFIQDYMYCYMLVLLFIFLLFSAVFLITYMETKNVKPLYFKSNKTKG